MNKIPTWQQVSFLTVLGLLLRLWYLNSTDIAGDEPFSIFVAQFEPKEIVAFLSTGNNPPLFELLLHFYIRLFGATDFTLRLFPAVCSALSGVPVFLIGKRFFNGKVALMASVLLLFSIYHIRFAHEVRVYSLFSLATAWSLYFFLTALHRPYLLKPWGALVLCNVVLLYAHFTSFYVLLIQLMCGLFFIPKNQWKNLFGALFLSGLFFSPYLLVFFNRLGDVSSSGTWVVAPGLGELYGSINLMLNQRLTTVVVIVAVAIGLAFSKKTELLKRAKSLVGNKSAAAVVLWFVVPYTLMFLCSLWFVPMFIDRYILYTSIPLFLCVALLVDEAWSRTRWPWVGVLLVVCGSVATTNLNPPNNRKIAHAVSFVKEKKNQRAAVYLSPDHYNLVFAYHYNRAWFTDAASSNADPFLALNAILSANKIFPIRSKEEVELTHERTIYLDADAQFVLPNNGILETLQTALPLTETAHFEQIFDVYVFGAAASGAEANSPKRNE